MTEAAERDRDEQGRMLWAVQIHRNDERAAREAAERDRDVYRAANNDACADLAAERRETERLREALRLLDEEHSVMTPVWISEIVREALAASRESQTEEGPGG